MPALLDNDARVAAEPDDAYAVLTKPHGHGDVHLLLHTSGRVVVRPICTDLYDAVLGELSATPSFLAWLVFYAPLCGCSRLDRFSARPIQRPGCASVGNEERETAHHVCADGGVVVCARRRRRAGSPRAGRARGASGSSSSRTPMGSRSARCRARPRHVHAICIVACVTSNVSSTRMQWTALQSKRARVLAGAPHRASRHVI